MLKKNVKLIFTIIGFLFGLVIAHPYVMLVYMITHPKGWGHPGHDLSVVGTISQVFSVEMVPMAAAFAIFCSLIGLLLAILFERNQKLSEMSLAMKRRRQVMESMHRLLSVLSHFIINSTLVIGTLVRRLEKRDVKGELRQELEKILTEAERNEEVMKLVNQCEFLENFEETDASMQEVLELTRKLEEGLTK